MLSKVTAFNFFEVNILTINYLNFELTMPTMNICKYSKYQKIEYLCGNVSHFVKNLSLI